jgi:polar amino acid transport system substrate-binding protein
MARTRTWGWRTAAILLALGLAAGACGDDDDDDVSADTGDTATTAAASETTAGDGTGETTPASVDVASLDLISSGTLTMCTDAPYPPFEFQDEATEEWTGFDMDIVRAIADDLGLELEVTVQPFDGIWLAPAAGTCDLVASAMTITEERAAAALFSDPYYDSGQSLLVRTEDAETYPDLESLDGHSIGVQTGTTGATYAEENAPDGAEIVEFDEPAAMFLALQSGDVDALLQDLPVNAERAGQDDAFTLVGDLPTDEQYGFATAQGNDALIGAINAGLATIREDGRYDEIYSTYFGGAPS